MSRERKIMQQPKNGGLPCGGDIHEVAECSRMKCPSPPPVHCTFSEWQDWAACDKCSGERKRFRDIATYAAHGGKNCELSAGEEVDACPRQCREKTYCTWTDWGSWGSCTAKCGEGKRNRQRKLFKTTVPSAPLPPLGEVGQVAALYSSSERLQASGAAPQPFQKEEMLIAFMGGFFSLLVGLAGFRAFTAVANSRSSLIFRDGGRDCVHLLEDLEERCIVEEPMLGDT
jgi:hypothetical protein